MISVGCRCGRMVSCDSLVSINYLTNEPLSGLLAKCLYYIYP